jgi:glycosyltransferase involved in cell wall biosynthesis
MGDARRMAVGVERLLQDEPLRLRLGDNAVKDAVQRFDIQRQANDLLGWYQEILQAWASRRGPIPTE